jgi:DNA adenine methylase
VTSSYTPLRYPGGKAKLGPYLSDVIRSNRLVECTYAEPYAGGAGAGLHLLFRGYASRLQLNDIDRGVVSFWRAVLIQTEKFAKMIERVPLTVAQWDTQKIALRSAPMGFDLGFAFFYLNRTNRSGIMNGGIIGGRRQLGNYLIDARFNRLALAARVRAIGTMKQQISVTRLDALEFIDSLTDDGTARRLVYLDPPYYEKGQDLYPNFYTPNNHAEIAERLSVFEQPWMMTYDDCAEIRDLYRDSTMLDSELSYSAREVRRGREVVVFGGGLQPAPPTGPTNRPRGFTVL